MDVSTATFWRTVRAVRGGSVGTAVVRPADTGDLTGKRAGPWVIVGPADIWRCVCPDCGLIMQIPGRTLRNGKLPAHACEKRRIVPGDFVPLHKGRRAAPLF